VRRQWVRARRSAPAAGAASGVEAVGTGGIRQGGILPPGAPAGGIMPRIEGELAMAKNRITWLGHGTFRIDTSEGKCLILDPWLHGNPACPSGEKNPRKVNALLITHGHIDHIADAVAIAKAHSPQVVCIWETGHWLESKGVANVRSMNKGGTQDVLGARVTMVHASHSCGILDGDRIVYGGEAAGYIIDLPGGPRLYYSGDTDLFGDMRLIGELYRPQIALLPIGDLYTMGPLQAAKAVELLQVERVIPMHWGTFPPLTGRPEHLAERVRSLGVEVIALKPGDSI
jgi:L-ascorbate metabolism protein UlaG (beta-lactamase superfamily)